jgi:precorrin-2 dehydrogenase/sirohydrochlorin ferrochelatase
MRYPLLLDIKDARCVVAGGGRVAERKVLGLLKCGARVTVIAPRATGNLQALCHQGRVEWEARPFGPEDAEGVLLLFAATDDPAANARILSAGRAFGALVNVADDPGGSDFHVPAVSRKGPVTVAVSTEGSSPALSAWLRDLLADAVPEGVEETARLLAGLRRNLDEGGTGPAPELFKKLLEAGVAKDLGAGEIESARRKTDIVFGPGAYSDAMKDIREVT